MIDEIPAPSVTGEGMWSWDFMARQFPRTGPPGLAYERKDDVVVGTFPTGEGDLVGEIVTAVDTLTVRNRKGRLVGVLSHYPFEIEIGGTVLEHAGNVSVWVDPRRRRRGIGTLLIAEADRRWSIDWSAQTYTTGGHRMTTRYLQRRTP